MSGQPDLTERQQRLVRRDDFWTAHFGYVLFVLATLVATSITVLGWQIVHWLKFGEWPPLTWQDALSWISFHDPSSSWVGLAKIIDWVMSLPLALAPMILAGLVLWTMVRGENDPDLKRARQVLAQRKAKTTY